MTCRNVLLISCWSIMGSLSLVGCDFDEAPMGEGAGGAVGITVDPSLFLAFCESSSSCGEGLECILGACSRACSEPDECEEGLPALAQCDAEYTGLAEVNECDVVCWGHEDCAPLGNAYRCSAGRCRAPGPDSDPSCHGDQTLGSDEEVREFAEKKCSVVAGDFNLQGSITTVKPLSMLREVQGELAIDGTELTSLAGLDSLEAARKLSLSHNPALASLDALARLRGVPTVHLQNDPLVESISALSAAFEALESLTLKQVPGLTSLTGLEGLEHIDYLVIEAAPNLVDLEGLRNLKSLGTFWLNRAHSLTGFEGLEGLEEAGGLMVSACNGLTNVDALGSLRELGSLSLQLNQSLSSIAGLAHLQSLGVLSIIDSDLVTLRGLEGVSGSLEGLDLRENAALHDLDALSGLTGAADVDISGNASLANVEGLSGLTSVGRVFLTANPLLGSLKGLDHVQSASFLFISQNDSLVDLSGLGALESATFLEVERNGSLSSLRGLDSLKAADALFVRGNAALQGVDGLEQLEGVACFLSIVGNPSLLGLQGLDGLESVGGCIELMSNASLPSSEQAAFLERFPESDSTGCSESTVSSL